MKPGVRSHERNCLGMQIYRLRNVGISILIWIVTGLVSPSALLWSQAPPASKSAAPALPADIPAAAERYSLLLMGTLAGQEAAWTAADDTVHIFFQFNDRGRGPKTTSILKLDSNGIPVSESITGNDYLKSPVDGTLFARCRHGALEEHRRTRRKENLGPRLLFCNQRRPVRDRTPRPRRSEEWRQNSPPPRRRSPRREEVRTGRRSGRTQKARRPLRRHRTRFLPHVLLARVQVGRRRQIFRQCRRMGVPRP